MKRTFLIIAASISVTSMLAQGTPEQRLANTMENGVKILPQAEDFAIGIDATPGLTYIGNIFNGATANSGGNVFSEGIAVRGKYFLEDNAAIRATFAMKTATNSTLSPFSDPTSTADKKPLLYDKESVTENIFGLTVGYELRRGYGKLQGFFGPEIGLGRNSNSTTYTYAMDMNKKNVEDYGQPTLRPIKTSTGDFSLSLGAFAGVEYFVLPKVSIGGEVSFGLNHTMHGDLKASTESWIDDKYKQDSDSIRQGSEFKLATRTKGSLFVNFHF